MKAVLIIFATVTAVFLAACVAVGALLMLAQNAGDQYQEEFFAAVASGDPEKLLSLCHDDIRQSIDPPMLAAWMDAYNGHHGEFQGLSLADFRTETKTTAEGQLTISEGMVNFDGGPAKSRLVWLNGQIVEWKVDSDLLSDNWFSGPKSNDLYVARGEAFLRQFLGQEADAAYALMHPALQEALPREKFDAMVQTVAAEEGSLKSIAFEQAELDLTDGQWLTVYFQVQTEGSNFRSKVRFQFDGLQGHLLAFEMNADA